MAEGDGVEWIGVADAAARLGVSCQAIYVLAFRRRLRKREGVTRFFVDAAEVAALGAERNRVAEARAGRPKTVRRKQGAPEGAEWISLEQAARIMGCSVANLYMRACYKTWEKRREGRKNFVKLSEVEATLRDPGRVRREGNWERKLTRLRFLECMPRERVDIAGAAGMLGVSVAAAKAFVYRGRLAAFQAKAGHSKRWLRWSEVEALRLELEETRAARARVKEEVVFAYKTPCSRVRTRETLRRGGTVEVGDLSVWEKYFGDWLTTRQAAWMLHNTQRAVCGLRQNGRLPGRKMEAAPLGRERWHYRKKDVLALMNDRGYMERCWRYKRRHPTLPLPGSLSAECLGLSGAFADSDAGEAGSGASWRDTGSARSWTEDFLDGPLPGNDEGNW